MVEVFEAMTRRDGICLGLDSSWRLVCCGSTKAYLVFFSWMQHIKAGQERPRSPPKINVKVFHGCRSFWKIIRLWFSVLGLGRVLTPSLMENQELWYNFRTFERMTWDFPGGPVVKTPHFQCGDLIPAQGNRIPHAMWCGQKKEKNDLFSLPVQLNSSLFSLL